MVRTAFRFLVLHLHLTGVQFCTRISTFEKLGFRSSWTSLVAQLVKNQPAMQETPVQLRVWEDPLEKDLHSMLEKATHSSILA